MAALDWNANVAYIQFGAYSNQIAAERAIDRIGQNLTLYRQQFPNTSFEQIQLLMHKGTDGLYRVYGDHFDSANDAAFVCRLFQRDFEQACFPIGRSRDGD